MASAVLTRVLLFGLLWAVLTGGSTYGLLTAAVTIIASALASVSLVPPGEISLDAKALLRFVPYFLIQSLRGGADVAVRAFRPGPPLSPAIVIVPITTPEGFARFALTSVASLMPGTLSVQAKDDSLHLHVLDSTANVAASIAELERRIAAIRRAVRAPPVDRS
jgi:multicomponent Na+:H+ antiporter subunit E